jgi:L-lactate dehydrogenase complex protein LldG
MVAAIFRSSAARAAVVAPDLGAWFGPTMEGLLEVGAKLVEDPAPESVAQADMGVSQAILAIAETGSVVVAGNDLFPRLATMLPLIHVVLIDVKAVVPSLDEAGEYLRCTVAGRHEGVIRYISFVSGPSRTADIEKTLSTGVHGPRELHIVLVE